MKPLPYGHQDISEEDIKSVVDALRSDFITQGPKIVEFEKALAKECEVDHVVAVCNATAALHVACLALGLKSGGRLWTSANTFVASANCGLYCGAQVDFVDIDPTTYNLSIPKLKEKLIEAQKNGTLPDVLVAVHFAGLPCDLEEIWTLSQKYGFKVLEDASHAIGAEYKKKKIGGCQFSHATVFSFHPVKLMTTGEGGVITTPDSSVANHMRRLRSHGVTREIQDLEKSSEGPWYYEQQELGFNYRMTDIHAALGLNQLKRLNQFVKRRHEIADQYDEALSSLPLILPKRNSDSLSSLHLYPVQLDLETIAKTKGEIVRELHALGIMVNVHYIPVPNQPYFKRLGFKAGQFPEAEKYYSKAISLPIYSGLTDLDQLRVVEALRKVTL